MQLKKQKDHNYQHDTKSNMKSEDDSNSSVCRDVNISSVAVMISVTPSLKEIYVIKTA